MATDLLPSSAGKKRDISEVLVDSMVRVDINSDNHTGTHNSNGVNSNSNERLAYYRTGNLSSIESRDPSPKKTKLLNTNVSSPPHQATQVPEVTARTPPPDKSPAVGNPMNPMVSETTTRAQASSKSLEDWTMVSVSENEFKMIPNVNSSLQAKKTEPMPMVLDDRPPTKTLPPVAPSPKTVRFREETSTCDLDLGPLPPSKTERPLPRISKASPQCATTSQNSEYSFLPMEEEELPPQQRKAFLRFLPNVGVRRCAGCRGGAEAVPATVWCVECSRCLCDNCDARCHETRALDHLQRPLCSHRVEEISGGGGLPILSPLLELAFLAAALQVIPPLWTGAGSMLTVDYFFESVCPIVQQIRRMVFRVDHALYPALRGPLGGWCDTEDAFLKVFSDLWVRGFLTHTDSFALLLMKMPSTIGALLVYLAILPLLAIPYALVATIVRQIEITLFPNWLVFRLLARLIRLVSWTIWFPFRLAGWVCRSTTVGLVVDRDFRENFHRTPKIPPNTGGRRRPFPSHSWADTQLMGAASRVTRVFAYFHRKARRAIIATLISMVFWTVSLRLVLLSIPRCGDGLMSGESASLSVPLSRDDGDCIPVEFWVRQLTKKLGVKIPDMAALGEEGHVLARMQEATENDYLDTTLQRLCQNVYEQFDSFPPELQWLLRTALGLFFFAGLVNRVLFWIDLRRRHRYRSLQAPTNQR